MAEKESLPKIQVVLRQNVSAGSADVIGCCGLYLKCSDAKQCLHPDLSVSENCLYRKNLEAGRIFYGKNAFDFSPDAYQELERTVSGLIAKELETFLFITQTFHFMLATQLCVYDSPELHVIVDRFPYSLQNSAPYILKYFRYDALVNAVPVENGQRSRCEEAVSAARAKFSTEHPGGTFDKKEGSPEAFHALFRRYRIIQLDMVSRSCLFAYLADHYPHLHYDYQTLKNCDSDFLLSDSIRIWDQARVVRHDD